MAVYTEVSFDEAAALFERLDTGALTALQPIASGIENTNYFADTAKGRYVLTLFERLTHAQLPFYLRLMKHLAERGIRLDFTEVKGPVLDRLRAGGWAQWFRGRVFLSHHQGMLDEGGQGAA